MRFGNYQSVENNSLAAFKRIGEDRNKNQTRINATLEYKNTKLHGKAILIYRYYTQAYSKNEFCRRELMNHWALLNLLELLGVSFILR